MALILNALIIIGIIVVGTYNPEDQRKLQAPRGIATVTSSSQSLGHAWGVGYHGPPWDKEDRRRSLGGGGIWVLVCSGKALPGCPAPSPTKDTKLVLSMSIQMPKQKIRLPRTWGLGGEGR
jgi:hypothetical protein